MKVKIIVAIIALIVAGYSCSAEAVSTVTVLDAGAGVSGVLVYAYNAAGTPPPIASAYTNSSGIATFNINDGMQVRFKFNYKCFNYDSGPVTTPVALTVNLPTPSIITVTNGTGGVSNASVYVYNTSGQTLGSVQTDSNGKAKCYITQGTDFTFTVKYGGFVAYESPCPPAPPFTAPVDPPDVLLPTPTLVTVLNGTTGVSGVIVYAYDPGGASYGNGTTNSSGQVYCYITEGIQIRFEIKYNGFISGESGFVTTPAGEVILYLPQPSLITLKQSGAPLSGVRVYAYNSAEGPLGYANTDSQGKVYPYVANGQLVDFRFTYGSISYASGLIPSPAALTVDLGQVSSITILDGGAGVSGIEVSTYDAADQLISKADTDQSGKASFYLESGTQFKFSFAYDGYSYESALLTAPADEIVNLPQESTVTVLDNGGYGVYNVEVKAYDENDVYLSSSYTDINGIAEFHITEGEEVKFKFSYRGFDYASEILMTPADITAQLPEPTAVTVLNGALPVVSVPVNAYDRAGASRGIATTDSYGNAFFYFAAGEEVVFRAIYDSRYYYTDWITTPSIAVINIQEPVKPESAGAVRIAAGKLYAGGGEFKIKGVCYQPTPVGEVPWASNWLNDSGVLNRDFSLLADIHVNAIRTWNKVSHTLMNSAEQHGIRVIAGYWMDPAIDYSNPAQRSAIKSDFKLYVSEFKHKPALLCWAIGNSQNRDVPYDRLDDWYSLVNEMAYEALAEEGIFYHPVAVVNDGLGFVGNAAVNADDSSMHYLDIWGTEVLAGQTFGGYFNAYTPLSAKLHWIASYGVDSYDNAAGAEDQLTQMNWLETSTAEILESDLTIGGTINEYSDEWWLAGSDWTHDTGGWPSAQGALPDNYANVEWWGIVSISDNGPSPDNITPKQAYTMLGNLFVGNQPPVLDPVGDKAVTEYETLSFTVTAADPDAGDVVTYSIEPVIGEPYPDTASIGSLSGEFEWVTDFDDGGVYRVKIKASDQKGAVDEETIAITVSDVPVTRVGGAAPNYATIQEAVDNTTDGDIIYIYPGTYAEDVTVDSDITIIGRDALTTIIEGNVVFKADGASIENIMILYDEGELVPFIDTYGSEIEILTDAGVTAVDAEVGVSDCIICPQSWLPDAAEGMPYGKGIQIWNLYGSPDRAPAIENNLIIHAYEGIYYYSHASGGALTGSVSNCTIDKSAYGIVLRMHKERPDIQYNIISDAQDSIHITYEDAGLLNERLAGITSNCLFVNTELYPGGHAVYCDTNQTAYLPPSNINEDPSYEDPLGLDYTPSNPDCADKGYQ